MATHSNGFIRAGTLDEIKQKGMTVIAGKRPLLVVYHGGRVFAVDNRCPHLGFPLHKGSVHDGILTCHWHHARFDLASGCTFDLWADDVPRAEVEIRGGEVWVSADCAYPDAAHGSAGEHWKNRLREGMEQNIGLIVGKAILGLLNSGEEPQSLVREAALFGVRHRDGWASGLTILTALANILPDLPFEEAYLALYQGIGHVANDCAGQPPRRDRRPLEGVVPLDTLKRWLRYWSLVRHRDGAERTLLTAIDNARSNTGASRGELVDLMMTAATDRFFSDGGHTLDFINKTFECLDLIGWDHAPEILPSVIRQLVGARGGEESNAWRHPVDLVPLLNNAFAQLPDLLKEGRSSQAEGDWLAHRALAEDLLGDDPVAIVESLKSALRRGARPVDAARALAYAAALRIARFGTANEFSDWIGALHTFTYCNALHQSLVRLEKEGVRETEAVRGVFHGAMAVYLDRFLNIPPARMPGERGEALDDLPSDAQEICGAFLHLLNTQQQVKAAARFAARYLSLHGDTAPLIASLARAVLREDADFHTFQMLEAGIKQYREWGNTEEGHHILIAVARYIAAHSPTSRADYQTARIAMRLNRGEAIYEEGGAEDTD